MKMKKVSDIKLSGTVVKGNMLGRKIGVPTINLKGDFELPSGIYACRVYTKNGSFLGALHYGPRPTINDAASVLEISLLDFKGDLYGETVEVEVYNKIREVKKFSGMEQLRRRIKKDIEFIRKNYA